MFKAGRTALENSFIGYDHSIIIEYNLCWEVFGDSSKGKAGIARVDVRRDLSGCDLVWETYEVRAGTGAKLSTENGLIYLQGLLKDTGLVNAWYATAIDFESGERLWRKYLGSGKQWDNAMLTVTLGPDGSLVTGMAAGLALIRDGE